MTLEKLQALDLTEEDWASFGPFEKLFLDLSDLLAELEELRWIDLEGGQLEAPLENYPVQFTCCLIDFPQSEYQDETRGNQQGIMLIQLRVAFDIYEDTQAIDGMNAADKGKAVKRLQLITKVHKKVHGFETEYSTPMTRTGIQTEKRDDLLKVFVMNYACTAKDDSAAHVHTEYTGAALKVRKINV